MLVCLYVLHNRDFIFNYNFLILLYYTWDLKPNPGRKKNNKFTFGMYCRIQLPLMVCILLVNAVACRQGQVCLHPVGGCLYPLSGIFRGNYFHRDPIGVTEVSADWTLQCLVTADRYHGVGLYTFGYLCLLTMHEASGRWGTETMLVKPCTHGSNVGRYWPVQ